jgi:hypothetical protein
MASNATFRYGAKGWQSGKITPPLIVYGVLMTHSAKQDAIHAIERLPDDVPLDEIVYRLYVLHKVQQGLKDIDAGRTIRSDDLAQEIEAW